MIGVFDSGIGGVTVMRKLLKFLPNERFFYYSDTINNPYGDKTDAEIIQISDHVVETLVTKGCKLIVIACNTASAIAKDYLRHKYDIPIIAIEPAYKSVPNHEKTLVMATNATINSSKFQDLFHAYDNSNTTLLACPGLADLIEAGDHSHILDYLKSKLNNYQGTRNVVLGCTHYPLIKPEIKTILGPVIFFDGSTGVARHTRLILTMRNLQAPANSSSLQPQITFFDSNHDQSKERLFFSLLNS